MISFDTINTPNWKYSLLYRYVNPIHNHYYYRKYYVLNKERIPQDAPVVAICNHQNGLSDALGILFAFKKDGRYPVFIARADIFKREVAAKALRFLRIMPAFRAIDVGKEGLGGNDAIFNKSSDILLENGVVCLFPEAGHEDCHHLGTFKKGFARIAFQAAESSNFEKKIYILPMSNHYSNYFTVQGKLVITIGEPFEFSDLYDIYKEHPQRAQKMLADRARVHVKNLMLDIEDKELYDEYDTIRKSYTPEYLTRQGKKLSYFPNFLDTDKQVVDALDRLRGSDEKKFNTLMKQSAEYSRLLDKLHLRDWIFRQKLTVLGFVFRLLIGIIALPAVAFSWVNNLVPFNLSTFITRRVKDQMLHSSFHFVVGVLFAFPLWYLILFFVVWGLTGTWWIALLYIAACPFSLLIYLYSKVIWKKLYNRVRRFRLWFQGNRFLVRAVELRTSIVKTMDSIME